MKGRFGDAAANETDGLNDSALGENAMNERSIADDMNLSNFIADKKGRVPCRMDRMQRAQWRFNVQLGCGRGL